MNPFQRLIRMFSPRSGERAYEAASRNDGWIPRRRGASANADIFGDAKTLTAKARALYQNVGFITAGVEGRVAHAVGSGIQHVPQGRSAKATLAAFRRWMERADVEGQLTYFGIQELVWRAMDIDGEALVRLIRSSPKAGDVPLRLQVLESDYLDGEKNEQTATGLIVNGIEYDAYGAPVAYWLFDRHPGDISFITSKIGRSSKRISAENIIHVFKKTRPGQGRGITKLAPAIADTRDLRLYQSAEADRKNLESRFGVMVHGGSPADLSPGMNTDSSDVRYLGDLPSGGLMQIPNGVSVTAYQARASGDYVEYVKEVLHRICASIGVTYELATGDLSEVNFTSSRAGRIAMKSDIDRTQWNTFIPMFCKRVHEEFVQTAILAGVLPMSASMDVDFTTPKWESVQPLDQAKADVLEIATGLSSLSEKQRERGFFDTKAVKAELASDIAELKSLGIWEDMLAMQGLTAPEAQKQQGKIT